jgi:hypothetical protein
MDLRLEMKCLALSVSDLISVPGPQIIKLRLAQFERQPGGGSLRLAIPGRSGGTGAYRAVG